MATINRSFNEILCKLVYYGPGMCGKTTNLEVIHGQIPSRFRGELVSLATETDRTLFFDYLPLDLGDVRGMKTKFQLFTVPGQVYYNATRKLVLRGVDGIVFVADSGPNKMDENRQCLLNLQENLAEYGYDLETIPWVLQYNKRDLPDAIPLEQLEAGLNPGVRYFEAIAVEGQGVQETLQAVSVMVLKRLKDGMDARQPVSELEVVAAHRDQARTAKYELDAEIPLPSAKALSKQGIDVPQDYPGSAKPVSGKARAGKGTGAKEPPLRIIQRCDVHWLGLIVGQAKVEFKSLDGNNGSRRYSLICDMKTFGLFSSSMTLFLTPCGEKWLNYEARSVPFVVYQPVMDEAADGSVDSADEPKIVLYLRNSMDKSIFIEKEAWAGNLRFSPEGKPAVFS